MHHGTTPAVVLMCWYLATIIYRILCYAYDDVRHDSKNIAQPAYGGWSVGLMLDC